MKTSGALVIGGGLAGLAAATVLAERGLEVTVLERERFVGGRAGAWPDRLDTGEAFQMERGFHAFFRQYYNLRDLMRRVDPSLSMLRPLDDYPLMGPDGEIERFYGLSKRPPFNLLQLLWRTPSLRMADLLRASPGPAFEMLRYDNETTYRCWDDVSAKAYLDSLALPRRARRMLFEVFAHSFFNREDEFSAAELLAQFHFYFLGNPEGLVFDVMRKPFSSGFLQPLRRRLEGAGVRFELGKRVSAVDRAGPQGFVGRCEDGSAYAGWGVVLALDVASLKQLVDRSNLGNHAWRRRVASLGLAPPFAVWRLWLDRPTLADRSPFAGTAGTGCLDNISLFHRIEDESEQWAQRTGGSVVELHGYALSDAVPETDVRRNLLDWLHRLYPETQDARIVEDRFLLREDCPGFAPGSYRTRPGVATPDPGLAVAGDFVRLDIPSALMERAVTSGFLAANRLLEGRDVPTPGQPVRTVSAQGLLALR